MDLKITICIMLSIILLTNVIFLHDRHTSVSHLCEQQVKEMKAVKSLQNEHKDMLNTLLIQQQAKKTTPDIHPTDIASSSSACIAKLGKIDKTQTIGNPAVRDEWIKNKAEEIASSAARGKGKVLDVSAGAKPYKNIFEAAGWRYFSSEFYGNEQVIDNFRGEIQKKDELKALHDFVSSDISNIGAESNHFDLVVLTEVLEHVPEPSLAITELARVAKPGAHILITSPFTSGSHQLPFHFSSGYSREWYKFFAAKNHLDVVEIKSQGNFFKLMAQEVERGFACGIPNPSQDSAAVEDLKSSAYWYFLQKSSINTPETATCYDQFTIGWMVHLQKRL